MQKYSRARKGSRSRRSLSSLSMLPICLAVLLGTPSQRLDGSGAGSSHRVLRRQHRSQQPRHELLVELSRLERDLDSIEAERFLGAGGLDFITDAVSSAVTGMTDEIQKHTAKLDQAFTHLSGKLGDAVKGAMKDIGVPWDCIAGGFEASLGSVTTDANEKAVAELGGVLLSFVPGANLATALADLGPALKAVGDGPLTADTLKDLMAHSAKTVGKAVAQDALNVALPGSGTVLALTGPALANAAQAVTDGTQGDCAKKAAADKSDEKAREDD